MTAFFDTSVMIAAFWGDHADHESSLRIFAKANRETGACGIHSLAEVYATMTALPVRPLLAPEQVFLFVQQIPERLTTIALKEWEYLETIRASADKRFGTGPSTTRCSSRARANRGRKRSTPGT